MSELALFCGHNVVIKLWGKRSRKLPQQPRPVPPVGRVRTVRQAGRKGQVGLFERRRLGVASQPASGMGAHLHPTILAYKNENVKGKMRRRAVGVVPPFHQDHDFL